MSDVYRAPVRYGVQTNSPIRIAGSNDPPFRIINYSPSGGTVWVSDNSGIQVGQGTPVAAGTSLLWVRPTELFAIAETQTDIIVSNEVEDWQPDPAAVAVAILNAGVLLIDNPITAFDAALNAGNGFSTGAIDISRYQSAVVFLECTALSAANDDFASIIFLDTAGNPLGFKAIELTAVSPNRGSLWNAVIPLQGAQMQVITSGCTVNTRIVLSNRAQENIDQTILQDLLGPQLDTNFYFNVITPFAGAVTTTIDINPWYGEIEIDVAVNSPAAPVAGSEVRWTRRNPATGAYNAFRRTGFTASGGTLYHYTDRIACAGDALRVDIVNTGVAPGGNWTNAGIRITPVNGFGGS